MMVYACPANLTRVAAVVALLAAALLAGRGSAVCGPGLCSRVLSIRHHQRNSGRALTSQAPAGNGTDRNASSSTQQQQRGGSTMTNVSQATSLYQSAGPGPRYGPVQLPVAGSAADGSSTATATTSGQAVVNAPNTSSAPTAAANLQPNPDKTGVTKQPRLPNSDPISTSTPGGSSTSTTAAAAKASSVVQPPSGATAAAAQPTKRQANTATAASAQPSNRQVMLQNNGATAAGSSVNPGPGASTAQKTTTNHNPVIINTNSGVSTSGSSSVVNPTINYKGYSNGADAFGSRKQPDGAITYVDPAEGAGVGAGPRVQYVYPQGAGYSNGQRWPVAGSQPQVVYADPNSYGRGAGGQQAVYANPNAYGSGTGSQPQVMYVDPTARGSGAGGQPQVVYLNSAGGNPLYSSQGSDSGYGGSALQMLADEKYKALRQYQSNAPAPVIQVVPVPIPTPVQQLQASAAPAPAAKPSTPTIVGSGGIKVVTSNPMSISNPITIKDPNVQGTVNTGVSGEAVDKGKAAGLLAGAAGAAALPLVAAGLGLAGAGATGAAALGALPLVAAAGGVLPAAVGAAGAVTGKLAKLPGLPG